MLKISTDLDQYLSHDAEIFYLKFDQQSKILSFTVNLPFTDDPFHWTKDDMKLCGFSFFDTESVERYDTFEGTEIDWESYSGEILTLDYYPEANRDLLEGCELIYIFMFGMPYRDSFEHWIFRSSGFTVDFL